MKDDQQEAYEKILSNNLVRVVDFLKFSEAKNAALLTFTSVWIIGSVNLLARSDSFTIYVKMATMFALPFFVFAAFIALYSFLPRLSIPIFHKDPEQEKSLLFFGDIAQFSPSVYRDRVRERYYPPENYTATQNYLDDLSIQIAINSQITTRKLRLFFVGAKATMIAMLILLFPAFQAAWRLATAYLGEN